MELSYTTFIMITLGSAAIQVLSSLYIWQHRTVPGAIGLFGSQFGGWVRMLFLAIEISSSNMLVKQIANNMRITGVIIGALFLLIFALQYTGRQNWLTGRRLYLILIPSIFVLIINWTNGWHHMFWESYPVIPKDGFLIPVRVYGSIFWFHLVNVLSLVFASFALLIYAAIITKTIYRVQAIFVFISMSPIIIGDMLFILRLLPNMLVNPSALGYAFGSVMLTWVLLRYRLVDLVPVAHHTLVQSMTDGMLVLDKQQRIVDLNPAAERFMKNPIQQAIGKPAHTLLPSSDSLLANLQQESHSYTELTYFDGEHHRLYEAQSSPIISRRGELTGWVIVLRDITQRKQIEEALRKSEADLAQAQESALLGSFRYVVATGEVIWSRQLSRMAGLGDQEQHLTLPLVLQMIHPDDHAPVREAFYAVMHGKESAALDIRMLLPDGTYRYMFNQFQAIYDAEGSPIEVFGTVQDITARKTAEESIKEARDAAETANRAKSTFLANMSHELRTPLNAILGFTRLLSTERGLAPKHYEQLAIIQRSGEHLFTLISSILDMSKIEAGRITLQNTSFNFYEMLDNLEALFQEQAEAKQIALRIRCDQDVPIGIITDEVKLRQVFINLLSNAIKFTDRGHVTLEVVPLPATEEQLQQDTNYHPSTIMLQCMVSDTGNGIAPEQLEEIFQPFVQGKTTHQAQGTGLGLAISRSFVELMGGTIVVQSELGQGTTFVVTIPVAVPTQEPFLSRKFAKQLQQHVITVVPRAHPYRILIVDDQWSNRQLLVSMLSLDGILLREAENGQAALDIWKTWEADVILMDIRMPVLDGYEAARHIRAMSDKKQPVIIAITASILAEDRSEVFASGCNALLFKPFHPHTLFNLLHIHLGMEIIYGDDTQPEQPELAESNGQSLSQDMLATIPLALWDKLEHTVLLGNNTLILQVAEEMRPYQPTIAVILQQLTQAFDYAEITHIVTQAKQVWHA
jgi:PAS domain S-box-containing protein